MTEPKKDELNEELESNELKETEKAEKELKWSTPKFIIGVAKLIFNLSTVSWGIYTFFIQDIIQKIFRATNGELSAYLTSPVMIVLVSGWVGATVIMGCNLQKAVAGMIKNAELKLNNSFAINAEVAKIVEAFTNKESK